MAVKAVFFDFDETLIATDASTHAAYQQVLEFLCNAVRSQNVCISEREAELAIEKFKEGLKLIPNAAYKSTHPQVLRTKLWQDCLMKTIGEERIKVYQSRQSSELATDIYNLWDETRMRELKFLEPVTQEVLVALRTNYILVLITNGSSVVQWAKIKQIGVESYFDHIIVTGDEPHDKPHVSVFEKACSMCGSHPNQCAMVGDTVETDILGANMANLAASILFMRKEYEHDDDSSRVPTHVVKSISQIPSILLSL